MWCGLKGFFKDLSFAQLAAGALAAATSFLLSSKIGIAGSLIGVVVGSVVSAVSTQVYKKAIAGSADALKQSLGIDTEAPDKGEGGKSEASGTVYPSHRNPGTGGVTQVIGSDPTHLMGDEAESDIAEETQAIASLDRDPTTLVGEGGAELYPAVGDLGKASEQRAADIDPTLAYNPTEPSRRARVYGAGIPPYGTAAYRPQVGVPTNSTTSSPRTSAYGSVATQEARARALGRKNGLIGVVTVLSALAAVAVVYVLVNVLTSGDGIGYRPPAIIASSDSQHEQPVDPQASAVQDQPTPDATPSEPSQPSQAGTTTTPGATKPEAGGTDTNAGNDAADPEAGDNGNAAAPDAGAGEGGNLGDAGATVTPGADAGAGGAGDESGTGSEGTTGGQAGNETTPGMGGAGANETPANDGEAGAEAQAEPASPAGA